MPLVRSAILLAVLVLVATVVGATLSLLREPDSGGRGRDSYGTEGGGYRAIHDVLTELGVPVERRLHPPGAPASPDLAGGTIAFLEPNTGLTGVEPTYLRALLPWVESGGRLLVATDRLEPPLFSGGSAEGSPRPTILDSLDLTEVRVYSRSMLTGVVAPTEPPRWDSAESVSEAFLESWGKTDEAPVPMSVRTEGAFDRPDWPVHDLALPGDAAGCLDLGRVKTSGRVVAVTGGEEKDSEFILAAAFPRGSGEIVLVAEPAIFANRQLARNDNAVLAARLLSPRGEPVVLDEFYHGLSVRGNSLYLLTHPGYAALAAGLLLCSCLVVWREAVFLGPPRADETVPRRDIGEYIAAMAQFFSRGRRTRSYLVAQLREGVLRQLSGELSLPPETRDVDLVAAGLSRTNPRRGERLKEAIRDVDAALASRSNWTETQTLDAMRRLTACLSKRA